ncbi:MAG: hypothetical protein EXQ69_04225 [Acidimicrobiia bacterium]|nr:hypothetical protein [Acidimicrobiia bacterium]
MTNTPSTHSPIDAATASDARVAWESAAAAAAAAYEAWSGTGLGYAILSRSALAAAVTAYKEWVRLDQVASDARVAWESAAAAHALSVHHQPNIRD